MATNYHYYDMENKKVQIKDEDDIYFGEGFQNPEDKDKGFISFYGGSNVGSVLTPVYKEDGSRLSKSDKVAVKEHTRNVNGKQVKVKAHERIPSGLSKSGIWDNSNIKKDILGRGKFSTFYVAEYEGKNHYFLKSRDDLKEPYRTDSLTSEDNYKHFPNLQEIGYEEGSKYGYRVYAVDRLKDLSAKDEKAWKQYKEAKKVVEKLENDRIDKINKRETWYTSDTINKGADYIEQSNLPQSMKDEWLNVNSDVGNYGGTIQMEMTPRNLKVNKNGDLVLNDIYFDSDQVK